MQGQYTMNAGTMNQTSGAMTQMLHEQDLFHNILILLKHNAREYATAVTESNCAVVRQTMQRLLHETLAEQADCYQVMSRQGWYPPAPVATRQDVQKSVQQHRQSAQNTAQSLQMTGIRPTFAQAGQFQNPLQQPTWQQQPQPQGQSWQATAQPPSYSQAQYQPVMQHNQSQPSDMLSPNSAHAGTLDQNAHIASGETQDWRHFSRSTGEATH